jgi:hypothetical protein
MPSARCTVHETTPLNGCTKVDETPITAMVWHLQGYKFTLHLTLIIISHSSLLLALWFFPLLSHHPCSPMFEQCNASGKTPMIDISSTSDEENFIIGTSRNAKLTKKLFGNLNRVILGPPDDDKIIILNDSDEENRAPEEKTAGIESTTAFASADPTSSAPTSVDNAPARAKIDNSEDQGPNQEADDGDDGGCSTGEP